MKALILAAGYGTRLLPYTRHTPKPLFPVGGKPLLQILIEQLAAAGCTGIIINTHHLHEQIEKQIARQDFPIPVQTRYEPTILGTGGAIGNTADFFNSSPFMVINSDILTDIDLRDVFRYHQKHERPATLVLHDFPKFNQVFVNRNREIIGFHEQPACLGGTRFQKMAFTGIQVLNPDLLQIFQERGDFNSIDLYRHLIATGRHPKAYIAEGHSWTDIGTPEAYQEAVFQATAPRVFQAVFPDFQGNRIRRSKLAGDGSDRRWYRLTDGRQTLILVDHGIREHLHTCEVDAFIRIGKHLAHKGIPVPGIYDHDRFAGQVYLEDMGDQHLADLVRQTPERRGRLAVYQDVIRLLVRMSQSAAQGFSADMTYQTATYSRNLIIEKECRYFRNAFLKPLTAIQFSEEALEIDFSDLAGKALADGVLGFMHRDFQSRNIMVQDGQYRVIDFQGGRTGPLQYDLASLLIDPYVALPFDLQMELIDFCHLLPHPGRDMPLEIFRRSVIYCSLTRNLQILGAFGFLSRVKQKKQFTAYIPRAVQALRFYLNQTGRDEFPSLKSIAAMIQTK